VDPLLRRRTGCRICDGTQLTKVLDLGLQPLANAFLATRDAFDEEARFPLEVFFCGTCGLVQLLDVVDAEVLFRNYIYVTGTSDTIARHNEDYARTIVEMLGLGSDDLVIELASNDGSLLGRFRTCGVRTLGVEPARNIAALARERGIETLDEFFNASTAVRVRDQYGAARAVIANNVLAHVDDTRDFLRGAASLLAPGGLVVIEVPYLGDMLDRLEYDTVYHEHLCYVSAGALVRLCDAVGLRVRRLDRVPVHGGSLRLYATPADANSEHARDAREFIAAEVEAGLLSLSRFTRFAVDVASNRDELRALLQRLRDQGKRLAGYGAPAKGNTLLNFCGIGNDLLPFTVDKSPHKVGSFTPGMHIPVLSVDAVERYAPDYLLLLPWNFADEIIAQQSAHRARGGRFIVPVPRPAIV
jgi:novobiocin biosynthesis protein NovU/D-mycarose 3-C-methyltransferase